ncbi:MAG: hypothetical protein QW781_00320 [Methanothrix sp.]|uniref:hypothetical protein n=1 Tax=Methanothrix sp. TaxID=90426 RepID=UPI00316914F6|nr:hypothetical protein [Methanothrix sp.]
MRHVLEDSYQPPFQDLGMSLPAFIKGALYQNAWFLGILACVKKSAAHNLYLSIASRALDSCEVSNLIPMIRQIGDPKEAKLNAAVGLQSLSGDSTA